MNGEKALAKVDRTPLHEQKQMDSLIPMIHLHPKFVTDADGHRIAVQLSVEEYASLLEEVEMADDIAAYDQAKAAGGGAVPLETFLATLGEG